MAQTGGVAEGRLSDWVSLGVLASWVPRDEVEDAFEAAGKGVRRRGGKLPPQVFCTSESTFGSTRIRISISPILLGQKPLACAGFAFSHLQLLPFF